MTLPMHGGEEIHESDLDKVVKIAIADLKENWVHYLRRCGYEYEEEN